MAITIDLTTAFAFNLLICSFANSLIYIQFAHLLICSFTFNLPICLIC